MWRRRRSPTSLDDVHLVAHEPVELRRDRPAVQPVQRKLIGDDRDHGAPRELDTGEARLLGHCPTVSRTRSVDGGGRAVTGGLIGAAISRPDTWVACTR